MTWGSASTARPRSSVPVRLPTGCATTAKGYWGLPEITAWAFTVSMNCSVQMTAVGTPRRSSSIPSCKLHVEQDPQSPIAVTTASHSRASASSTAPSARRLALPFAFTTTSRRR